MEPIKYKAGNTNRKLGNTMNLYQGTRHSAFVTSIAPEKASKCSPGDDQSNPGTAINNTTKVASALLGRKCFWYWHQMLSAFGIGIKWYQPMFES
jgi:hypothetical protein